MRKQATYRSESEHSLDEGFIVATGQVTASMRKSGMRIRNADTRNEPGGRDESDDLETEKAESFAQSM